MRSVPANLKHLDITSPKPGESDDQHKTIINWVAKVRQSSDGTKIFARKVPLENGQTVTQLFARSEKSDFFKRLTHPIQRETERKLAYTCITDALALHAGRTDIKMFLDDLASRNNKYLSLKLDSLGSLKKDVFTELKFINQNLEKYEGAHKSSPPSFENWQFESNPGLDKFCKLNSGDFDVISASLDDANVVKGFQSFIRASTTNDKAEKINSMHILSFIKKWSALKETEKNALVNSKALSNDARVAFAAVDTLVHKVAMSVGLDINVSDNLGLSREFACSNEFLVLKNNINMGLGASYAAQPGKYLEDVLGSIADKLGDVIATNWKNKPAHEIINFYAMEQQLQTVMRNFLNEHIAVHLKETPPSQSMTLWKIYSENFIERACSSAILKFYAGNVSVDSKTNNLVIDNNIYKSGAELGFGGQGSIEMAVNKKKNTVAIKTMKAKTGALGQKNSLRRISTQEISSHYEASKVANNNVLAYHGTVVGADGIQRMAMEYAPNGDVSKLLEKPELISPTVMLYLILGMAKGIAHIHENSNLIHQDIKPANFVIDASGNIKLTDFGAALPANNAFIEDSLVDSYIWRPPECVGILNRKEITKAVDVWALGITILEMAGGKSPVHNLTDLPAIAKLQNFREDPDMLDPDKRSTFLGLNGVSDENLRKLINDMLHPVPSQRSDMQTVLAYFNNLQLDEAALKQTVVKIAQSAK